MKLLAYNIRGVGSRIKRREIQELVRKHKVDLVCIQESKLEGVNEEKCKLIWGNSCGWEAKDAEGRAGGIITLWNPDKFVCSSSWHMNGAVIVNDWWGMNRVRCCIINVYAPCPLEERIELWDRLRSVVLQNSDVCVCLAGDFNSIRFEHERSGVSGVVNRRDIWAFENFISGAELTDLPLYGRKFTWYRPNSTCKSRLDRIMVNNEWLERWPGTSHKGLPRSISDHCPLILETKIVDWGHKPFRFINAWTTHCDFKETVSKAWSNNQISGWGGFVVKEKLKALKDTLKQWNHSVFGAMEKNIEDLRKEIQELDIVDDVFGLVESEVIRRNKATAELFKGLNQRNSLWAQKARVKWIKEGDMNTSFFHKVVNQRRKGNEIAGIQIGEEWVDEVDGVKNGIRDFFRNHFSNLNIQRPSLPQGFSRRRISEEDNIMLCAPFSEIEVRAAIWSCEDSKSPGPDGFNFRFFKECWEIVKADIMRFMEEFHRNGKLVRGLNPSYIVLIPKKEDSRGLNDFRPISLIGSIYKILAKVLAGRLCKVMDSIISENQSAFVGNRMIHDGIVILNEAVEEARRRKIERVFFKIDFAKAYDTVDWKFLEAMFLQFNFCDKWTRWMIECVSTATANVLVNGSPSGEFKLERGLRQGDPLSPFLFLIVAEGLGLLVNKAIDEGLLEAAVLGREKILVSHLQYADDTIFISSAKQDNAWAMRCLLRNFELISGLKVNYSKSSIMGINVDRNILESMAGILGCVIGTVPFSYLGIKVGVRYKRELEWSDTIQKVKNRLKGWEHRKLSIGGRVTLLNAVLTTIPIYHLSFSCIPRKSLRALNSVLRNFLWGGGESLNKIAWVKWEYVCFPKEKGGLGVKDIDCFNKALVSKWLWRFLSCRDCLWVKVITSLHGMLSLGEGGFVSEGRESRWSCWWREVVNLGRGESGRWLWENIEKRVGNGGRQSFGKRIGWGVEFLEINFQDFII